VNPLNFDRLTLSQRKLAAGGLGIVWGIFVVVMFGPCDRAGPVDAPLGSSPPPDVFEHSSEPTAEPQAAIEGESNGSVVVSHRAVRRARGVASGFVEAYATYSFEDGPDQLADRIQPYVTPSLAAQFELSSGAGAFYEELTSSRERAVVEVEAAQTQIVRSEAIEFLVVAKRVVRSAEGREVERPTYLVWVSRTNNGWKVTALTL
jgi:hypothetical protein